MRVLAISADNDPLFVRNEDGLDYEVEVHWINDARFRNWENDGTTPWDAMWDKISSEFIYENIRDVSVDWRKVRGYLSAEPTLVKPALRILTAHRLPHLEERAEQQRRARAVKLLGGEVAADEIVLRREKAEDERWHQRHPKARPSHPSVWLPDFIKVQRMKMNVPFTEASLIATRAAPLDEVHTRRAEAMRRLQDPPVSNSQNIVLDGIKRRNVL